MPESLLRVVVLSPLTVSMSASVMTWRGLGGLADHSVRRKTVPSSVWGWGRLLNRGRLLGVSNTFDSVGGRVYYTRGVYLREGVY